MSTIRDKLGQKTSWVKETSAETPDGSVKFRTRKKRHFIQVDPDAFDEITRELSRAANTLIRSAFRAMDWRDNCFDMTGKELSEFSGLDIKSVEKAMKELKSVDFCRKVRRSKWMVNPGIAFSQPPENLDNLLDRYFNLDYVAPKEKDSKGDET